MLPTIVLSISISILLFNLAFLLFNLLKPIKIDHIWQIITFIILSLFQICIFNKGGKRITEVTIKFSLDSLPCKQMAIEAELSSGLINEQEEKYRKNLLLQEVDFFKALDRTVDFLVKIPKLIFMLILIVIIIFITSNIIRVKLIGDDIFNNVIICGIISQLMLTCLTVFVGIIISRYAKEPTSA